MSRYTAIVALTLVALLAGGAATAVAQDDDAEADDVAPSDLTSEENLDLLDEDIDELSEDQMRQRGADKIEDMREGLDEVEALLSEAREEERDILKINCINEKQAAIKGFVNVSEESYANLEEAIEEGDEEAVEHHYTLIAVAEERVAGLVEEATLCTGEEQRYAGETELEVEEPDNGREDADGPDEDLLADDLPELTPYQ